MKLSLAVHISTEVLWGFGQSFKNKSGQTKGVRMNKAAVGVLPCDFPAVWFPAQLYFLWQNLTNQKTKNQHSFENGKWVVICLSSLANWFIKISFKPSFPVKLCKHFILTKKSQNPRNKKLVKLCLHFS